jgi:hypothetical protein
MARLNCLDCPKTFKGEGGLEWHRKRSHSAGFSAEGTAVTATVGQEPPIIVSAAQEDPEWWPSVDDLFQEDEPLALHDLLNRGFPELAKTVEALAKRLDQALLEQEAYRLKVRDLESKLAALVALTRDITRRLGAQVTRGDRLEQRMEATESRLSVLSELVGPLLVMVLHADGHQRGENMNYRSLLELLSSPPKWTLWRHEEVYEEARQKLLEFLGSGSVQHASLLSGLPTHPPGTNRATPALRG